MGAIVSGDEEAIWALRNIADRPVRSRLRAELRRLDVRYDADDLEGMVIDAVVEIARVAGAWQPGGAFPWSWAYHRVTGVVHDFVGVFARSLEQVSETTELIERWPGASPESVEASADDLTAGLRLSLRRLAAVRPSARDLDTALSELVSLRDAAVWLGVESERAAGNRHPAVTVGAWFGMTDAAVRKVVQRVRRRLAGAIADGRYPGLSSLPVFAGQASVAA